MVYDDPDDDVFVGLAVSILSSLLFANHVAVPALSTCIGVEVVYCRELVSLCY